MTATKETPGAVERMTNDGFDEFYRRHRHRLIALAYAVSGTRLGAEDLAHDALEAAYRDWDRIRDLDNPTAWVQRMVTNRAVSAYRRRLSELRTLTRLRSETHTRRATGDGRRATGDGRRATGDGRLYSPRATLATLSRSSRT